jgi:hypothetical protein
VVLDLEGFNAFSEISSVVDSKIDLTIYSCVIPIRLLAIKAQSIIISYVGACLEYCGIQNYK